MSKIHINKKPFSKVEYYDGVYKADTSDNDDEARIHTFDFTLELACDLDNDFVEIIGITWIDEEPSAKDFAEDRIKEKFYDQIS